MTFLETDIKGAFIITINAHRDERGFFGRAWCANEFAALGLNVDIKQMNTSYSEKKGTLRGLHYQQFPYEETKLVRCMKGGIFDVIIDLRQDSPTYKQWFGVELKEDNLRMFYVPEGCAHGFITLQNHTEVIYMVTQFYTPEAESGIRWNDPAFNIIWPIQPEVISNKDRNLPDFIVT